MRNLSKFLFALFILFSCFLGFILVMIPSYVYAQEVAVDYTFSKNTPYVYDSIDITNHNLRVNNITTLDYNSSYSFSNDIDYSDTPINFGFTQGTGADGGVLPELDKHYKSFEGNKTTSGAGHSLVLEQLFESSQTYGTIEFFVQMTDVDLNHANYIQLKNGGTNMAYIHVQTDLWQYDDGVTKTIPNVNLPFEDIWQHVRIDFELTLGGYLGMAQYQTIFTIDGISSGAVNVDSNEPQITSIRFACSDWHTNYGFKVDDLGYSWLYNYTIGNNLTPIINETNSNVYSSDKYDFSLDSNGLPYIQSDSPDIYGWDRTNPANVFIDNEDYYTDLGRQDYGIVIQPNVAGRSMWNDTLQLFHEDINMTFGLRYGLSDEITGSLDFLVYSKTENEIINLQFDTQSEVMTTLQYYDGVGYNSLVDIYGINDVNNHYEFNVYVVDYDVFLLYYMNGVYNSSYTFDLINDEWGISEVKFTAKDPIIDGNYFFPRLSYVGLYQYNISICKEWGYVSHDFNTAWNSLIHNIFEFDGSNEFLKLYVAQYGNIIYYQVGVSYDLINSGVLSNESFLENLYEESYHNYVFNCTLFVLTNTTITPDLYNFTISGVNINDGITNYSPTYNDGNIDTDVNYFYVEGSDLHYNLTCDDSNNEFLNIIFDLPNALTTGYSFVFNSYNYNLFGKQLRINYADYTTSLFNISYGFSSTRNLMANNKVFVSLDIIIGDDNLQDDYNGTGYFNNFKLQIATSHAIEVVPTNLLNALTPLLFVILMPTLTIAYSLDKSDKFDNIRKKIIVPLLAIFSIVAFWFAEIELWMLFLILLGFGVLFFISREGD